MHRAKVKIVQCADEQHMIALFLVLETTTDYGKARIFILTGHRGLLDPFKALPIAPLPVGDAKAADAQKIHRGGRDSAIWVVGHRSCVHVCVNRHKHVQL